MTTLALVDRMLKVVLEDGVPSLAPTGTLGGDQVFFDPPDAGQSTATRLRLNVYLVDVRENVKLRSNERQETRGGGAVVNRRAPYRLDCHYLISAFAGTSAGEPPLQHDLLYETTRALVRSQPLVPARVLAGHAELAAWPPELQEVELPLTINPPEGFPKLAEFWGTMPHKHPWRPVVHAVVTVPVDYADAAPVGVVHHTVTVYSAAADAGGVGPGQPEGRGQLGGTVLGRDGSPVGRARVFALDAGGVVLARTTCGDDGRFVIDLPGEVAQVHAAAFGFGTTPPLAIPVAQGAPADAREYILRFP